MSNKNNHDLENLLKRLPKKYHERVETIERESGLIDDCPFMLYLNEGYSFYDYKGARTFPVKSITEAIEIIKGSVIPDDECCG